MVGSQLSSEAERPLVFTLEDFIYEDFIYEDNLWQDETQYGQEIDESMHGRNLPEPAYTSNLPAFESRLQEETPSLSTTPREISDSNSAPPFSPDQSAPEPYTNYSDSMSNADSSHSQSGRYYCSDCNKLFRLEKDLRRHFETTMAHRPAAFQCCCTYKSGRKDNFLKHIERKRPCSPAVPFICLCGYRIESNNPDAIDTLLKHIRPCGQRKRGRPKK